MAEEKRLAFEVEIKKPGKNARKGAIEKVNSIFGGRIEMTIKVQKYLGLRLEMHADRQ